MMQAPCENKADYAARLAKEREIHEATRENMIRRDINLETMTQLPYLRPEGRV